MATPHHVIDQPLTLPTFAPTASTLPLAVAATLPPARRFALAEDGRAIAFDGAELQAHTSAGSVANLAEAPAPLAPGADSPIIVIGDSAYWVADDGAEIVGVSLSGGKPSVVVRGASAIGGLVADEKSLWFTAGDGKTSRKLMRADVTARKVTATPVVTWASSRTSEPLIVTDAEVFLAQPAAVVRVLKAGGRATTLVTLAPQEQIGALALSADALYFTVGAPNEIPHDLYRVPLAGGDRTKVLSSSGGVGDVVVSDKDVLVAGRLNTGWEIDSLPGGDVAQITIVASDVGRQPRLHASTGHVAWSTGGGVSFADL
jgi:hypothetical protein